MKKNSLNYFFPVLITALLMFGGVATRAQQSQSSDQTDTSSTKSESKSKKKPATAAGSPVSPAAPVAPIFPSAPAAPATPATSKTATASKPAAQQKTPPANSSGMVWINTDSRVYHKPGSHWYGKTKHGKYMTEADAQKAGYRPAEKE